MRRGSYATCHSTGFRKYVSQATPLALTSVSACLIQLLKESSQHMKTFEVLFMTLFLEQYECHSMEGPQERLPLLESSVIA